MKFKTKRIIKVISLIMVGVAVLTALGFGVKAIVDYTKADLTTIKPTFEVGNLGSDGKYVNDESTLYTKEAFGCYGLQVKPDFDSAVNYQIFYYDILDNFISSTAVLSEGFSAEAPLNGAYARMVIIPKEDEDDKISFTEKIKYASDLTIKVKKNQDINNRFDVLGGKVLQRANMLNELVFVKGLHLSPTTLMWDTSSTKYCVTSTFLSVSGGSKISESFTGISGTVNSYQIFEFSDLSLADNFIKQTDVSSSLGITLDKKTKYIIISVYKDATDWTDSDVVKLYSCFSITK